MKFSDILAYFYALNTFISPVNAMTLLIGLLTRITAPGIMNL